MLSWDSIFFKIYFILLEKLERGLETEGENERQRKNRERMIFHLQDHSPNDHNS